MIEVGTGSIPVLVDVNGDGLLDLIVANFYSYKPVLDKESRLAYYQNTGSSSEPKFTFVSNNQFNMNTFGLGLRVVPCFGDIDGDGDLDMIVGNETGRIHLFTNSAGAGNPMNFSTQTFDLQDEDGNIIEPAVKAVEGKEAWTETFNKREAYLGNLDVGVTFEEDGFTKTVVDDGNERLPKVKISDVVSDKAVYGVFQTWDEVEDMLISSLGAFVVRVAAGVTVEVGDLLESNGDGCAKVQDDDIIRSKTIGKVTSTVATDTYDDGSYTVPCVLYCG
jgi:hypothetical protein